MKAQEVLPPVFRTERYMMVQKGPLKLEGEIKILQSHKTELQSGNKRMGCVLQTVFKIDVWKGGINICAHH